MNLPGDDNFSLAVQFEEIAEENGSDIIRVIAGMEEEAAVVHAFHDARNGIEQGIAFDLLLECEDFRTNFGHRTAKLDDADAKN